MMYEIHLSNNQQLLPINESLINEAVRQTLSSQNVSEAEIVVALVDDAAIHEVNRDHLQHDYPTDVISFLYEAYPVNKPETQEAELLGQGMSLDGELVISTETAIREAESYQWNALDELRLYVVHGLLHLCGYDDQTDEDQQLMRTQERAILKFWNLTPHYM